MLDVFATLIAVFIGALIVGFLAVIVLAGLAVLAGIVLMPIGWLISLFGDD